MVFLRNNSKWLFVGFFLIACLQATLSYANGESQDPSIPAPVQTNAVQSSEKDLSVVPLSPSPSPSPSSSQDGYRVGPDDELKITVFGEDNLTGTYSVNGHGALSMPLIGEVVVLGLSLKDIEGRISDKLKEGYLLNPSVSVEVTKYRPFYILGEVRVPGSYGYVNNMSVLNAVALAGGFTYRANKKTVQIMRPQGDHADVSKNQPVGAAVLPGDIILVKERFF